MAELIMDQERRGSGNRWAVLGGGGGGSMAWGRELAQLAARMGTVRLVDIDADTKAICLRCRL